MIDQNWIDNRENKNLDFDPGIIGTAWFLYMNRASTENLCSLLSAKANQKYLPESEGNSQ